MASGDRESVDLIRRFTALRQYQKDGKRAPHKPLLVLLALGRLAATGSSETPWAVAEKELAHLIAEFGPPSRTHTAQSAAYPFTHLRSDDIWRLDRDVPMGNLGPLRKGVTGRFEDSLEQALRARSELIPEIAREVVDRHFPPTVAADVLLAVGFDPEAPHATVTAAGEVPEPGRRRDPRWRLDVIEAWDRQCAFCGFDGQAGGVPVGLEAAHVRWFAMDGPDELDNGLALCMLHHKLFDRGMLGLDEDSTIVVSQRFSARTGTGRAVYDLHGQRLAPRPGTPLPAEPHVAWHRQQVFQGLRLTG